MVSHLLRFQEQWVNQEILQGLPRVTELFEARNPSNPAVVSEIDGVVTYGGIKRGNREIFIESKDGVKKKYMVPLSKHILVQDNDFVKRVTSYQMVLLLLTTSLTFKVLLQYKSTW